MAILWMGGEDIDFPINLGTVARTSAGAYRDEYARCAIGGPTGNVVSDCVSNPFPGGGITNFWLTARPGIGGFSNAGRAIGLVASSSGALRTGFYIGVPSLASSQICLMTWDGTTSTIVATEVGNSWIGPTDINSLKFDLHVVNFGASSTVTVYVNGTAVINYTGVTAVGGITSVDSVCLHGAGSPYGGWMNWSEIIVSDQDTRTFSLRLLVPNATGTTDQWTGAYTDVNEVTVSDANVVSTNTVGQDEQFNLTDLPAGTFVIRGVKEVVRASTTVGATATKVALGINSGGTVDAGTQQALTTAWLTYERIMQTNPITSASFTTAEINSIQANLRSGS